MEHIFRRWGELAALIRRKRGALLFLDYDGTLTAIAGKPEWARLPAKTKELLVELRDNPFFTLAIISGRSLKEIRRLVEINGIIYAGNHGLELKGPGLNFVNKKALSKQRLLRRIYGRLRDELSLVKGVFVEDKGLTLSVHFRLADRKDMKKVKTILDGVVKQWVARKKIKVTSGKMVYEVRPAIDWDKGKIVKWLLRRKSVVKKGILPVCVGDDRTDEDMFKAVGKRGITVCVGKTNPFSRARFYLKNTEEVKKFLDRLNMSLR